MESLLPQHSVFQPLAFALQNPLRHAVPHSIRIVMDVMEELVDPKAGVATEVFRHADRISAERRGAGAGGRYGKQFRTDIDESSEQHLLLLQLRPKADHCVE